MCLHEASGGDNGKEEEDDDHVDTRSQPQGDWLDGSFVMFLVLALVVVIETAQRPATVKATPPSTLGAPTEREDQASLKTPMSSATLKWANGWAMAAFGKASGEGEPKMNQPAGESGRKEAHDARQDEYCPGSRVAVFLLQQTWLEMQRNKR